MRFKLIHTLLIVLVIVALVPLLVLEFDVQARLRDASNAPGISRQGLESLAQRQQLTFLACVVGVLILIAIGARLLGSSIVRPIHHLQSSARRLLAGEFPTFDLPDAAAAEELLDLSATLRQTSSNIHALVIEAGLHSQDLEKLYQDATRRATALETIRRVSQRISTILDIDDLLPEIVALIRDGFDYDRVHLFTVDPASSELVLRTGAGRAGRVAAEVGERTPIDEASTIGQVALSSQALLVKDVAREPSAGPLPETRCELAVPLVLAGRMLGVLSVQSDRPNAFDNQDLFVVQEIANQAAGAITNAQLYEEAFTHAEEIMALLITSVAVSTAPDLDTRLEAIAHHARRLMDADGCTVFRLDEQANSLRPLISLDPYSEQLMAMSVPVGSGITGQVVQSGRGQIVNHTQQRPDALLVNGTPEEPECLLAVPLLIGDRSIGAMTVHRQGTREFVPHDLELLGMFASQAAVAIENAELYQQIKERADILQKAYRELEEADRIKDEMIQNISHELRTPLTFVIGYLGLILDGDLGPLTDPQRESLRIVHNKASALTRMVNDIITLQTIRITQPELGPVDITELMQRAIDLAQPAAKRAAIDFVAEFPAKPLQVNGEASRLGQVLDNIIGNAIKFSPEGGTITLRVVEIEDDMVRVEVQDTGIGIPAEHLEKVFERFYQIDGTATRRFGGIGMGLAICKEIVKAHGGQIWADSPTSGEHGSTFYFTLHKATYEQFTTDPT